MPPRNRVEPISRFCAAPAAAASTVSALSGNTGSALSTISLVPAPAGAESIYHIIKTSSQRSRQTTRYRRAMSKSTRARCARCCAASARTSGVRRAWAQRKRTLEWEKQQKCADVEHHQLMAAAHRLLLLLAVLVFMTLTRGSRGEAVMVLSRGLELGRPTKEPELESKPAISKLKEPSDTLGKPEFLTTAEKPAHAAPPPQTPTRAHARHAADDGALYLAGLTRPAERARTAHLHELRGGASGSGVCACAAARRRVIRWQPSGRHIASGPLS
ncbi:hypothetical protein C8R45DRAFT_1087895 [Mycena sanguinolenta]|nr:hypothetical protein C8R45DRAFT_1087895 [Mycena sanguinolenta]